jgi:glycine/serine hydroxymethyltransferase
MSKASKPAAAMTMAVVEPPVAAEAKPQAVHIFKAIPHALAEAAVHIRAGMIFNTDMPVEVFGATGQISFHLVRGNPEQHYVDVAKVTSAEALDLERVTYERDVQAAAKQLIEDAARAAKKAEMEAAVAVQAEALRKLQAELAKA